MTGATQKRLCVRGFAWWRTVGLLLTTLLLLLALCACSGREHVEDGDGLNNPGSTETDGQEMKSLTEPTLSLTLTVPAAWDDIAELSACDKGTAYLGYGIMLFHLSEKNALAAYPDGGMGSVWWLDAMSWDNFKEWRGYDALPVPEILGIAEYVLGADDEYVYLLVLPSDVQWLENDPVSKAQYEQLCADSQEVLERFLNDSGIVLNVKCPNSRVFSAEKMLQEDAARDYISYLSGSTDLASAKKGSLLHCEFPGMSALTAALPLEDAEREAVLKWANTEKVDSTTRIDYYAAIAVRQHYLVLEQFGDNAWENVSYTFEKIDSVDGALGYRIIETGESIGAAEYRRKWRRRRGRAGPSVLPCIDRCSQSEIDRHRYSIPERRGSAGSP